MTPPKPHILIVNHHDDTNRVMMRLLRMSGYEADAAPTLAEAQHIISTSKIDLLICRVTAADGDAVEFIERAFHRFKIPTIAIAGSLESQSRAARLPPKSLRAVIPMPFDLPQLLAAIKSALAHSRARPGICPDCHGKGTILLLTSRQPCQACEGTGLHAMRAENARH